MRQRLQKIYDAKFKYNKVVATALHLGQGWTQLEDGSTVPSEMFYSVKVAEASEEYNKIKYFWMKRVPATIWRVV